MEKEIEGWKPGADGAYELYLKSIQKQSSDVSAVKYLSHDAFRESIDLDEDDSTTASSTSSGSADPFL